MVKKILSRDVKSSLFKNSSWEKDLLSGEAGKATNLRVEKKHLYEYFKKSYRESGGNTTVAIAKTMGYLKNDPQFSTQERLQVKSGLKERGYFVPDYSIKPKEEKIIKDNPKTSPTNRDRREDILARGKEKRREFISSKATSINRSASVFQNRPRF